MVDDQVSGRFMNKFGLAMRIVNRPITDGARVNKSYFNGFEINDSDLKGFYNNKTIIFI
jgi:hypothetical protein